MGFVVENIGTIAVGLAVVCIAGLVIRSIVKKKGSCSCDSSCSCCQGKDTCHPEE